MYFYYARSYKGSHSLNSKKNHIFVVLEFYHSKQGRGKANVKVKMKDLRTGAILTKIYTSGIKLKLAHISKKNMKYLYNDGINLILMDDETFEQIEIPIKKVKWEINFLKNESEVLVKKYKNEILNIELPLNVKLKVIEAPNAIRGNTQNNPQKKVKVETGYELKVPMFIKENE